MGGLKGSVHALPFLTMMHKFLKDEKSLERIKKAAFIDNGTVIRS